MLSIKVEGTAGMSLKDELLPEMLDLAKLTDCIVECRANDTLFIVYPQDTVMGIQKAYDRLYPDSTIVMSSMTMPFPRRKSTEG